MQRIWERVLCTELFVKFQNKLKPESQWAIASSAPLTIPVTTIHAQ